MLLNVIHPKASKNYKSAFLIIAIISFGIFLLVLSKNIQPPKKVVLWIGLIGIWRYSIQIVHLIRNLFYKTPISPNVSKNRTISHLYIIVTDYKIPQNIRGKVFASLIESCQKVEQRIHIVYTSDLEATSFLDQNVPKSVYIYQQRQMQGKRKALADAIDYCKALKFDPMHSLVVFMDGDTGLDDNTLQNSIDAFVQNPLFEAITTNERLKLIGSSQILKDWYTLKFSKRNHYMKSHHFSNTLMTLTGRFSVFEATNIFSESFTHKLKDDSIDHWLHGKIPFLMGDDKTTCFYLQNRGVKMGYLNDTFVTSFESQEESNFFQASTGKMTRWYGNMIRNAPRTIIKNYKQLPIFILYCYFDQLISCFTTLIGPMTALIFFFNYGPKVLVTYLGLILVTRGAQLLIIIFQGHRLSKYDIFLQIYDQWIGSLIKIFCLFFPHIQNFALRDDQKFFARPLSRIPNEISYYLMIAVLSSELGLIYWITIA